MSDVTGTLIAQRDAAWAENRRLVAAMRAVWDKLNELRQDAQELEDAVFKALDVVDPNGPHAADIAFALEAVKAGRVHPLPPFGDSVRSPCEEVGHKLGLKE